MNIPKYQTYAGQIYPIKSIGNDDERVVVIKTTFDEALKYANLLEDLGYSKACKRLIPSGVEGKDNLFFSCQDAKNNVVLFYDYSRQTCEITVSDFAPMPKENEENKGENGNKEITYTQFNVDFGSCHILTLSPGEFILIDGGNENEADLARLIDYLGKGEKDAQIKIKAWFFTHPDSDHITLATKLINTCKSQLQVESFIYQFPNLNKVELLSNLEFVEQDQLELEKAIKTYQSQAVIYTAHTGEIYRFLGVDVEILFSPDNTYPYLYPSPNDYSLALRLSFDDGKKAVLLGDCMCPQCRQIAHTYGKTLKADILQVAHHGLIGGDLDLYKMIDPSVCLWDVSQGRFNGSTEKSYKWCLGEGGCDYNAWLRDEKVKKREHYTQKTINVFKLNEKRAKAQKR